MGNAIEIFHLTPPPKPRKKSLHQLQENKGKESLGRKTMMWKTPRERITNEKGKRNAPTQSKGEKKKISLNTEKKKKKRRRNPMKISGKIKSFEECSSPQREYGCSLDGTHKVQPSGQGKDKSTQTAPASLTKASSFAILRKSATPTSSARCSSRKHTYSDTSAKETLNLSNGERRLLQESDSEHEKDGNLEADAEGALPAAEGGTEEILPKNDIYDALWVMLDTESENEAEEIPGQWDLDSVLNNWGKVKPNMGPAGNDQGPPPAAN
ncbi:hypothetical protein PIB30_103519 [Stylosanthes scabra]|uniref:Uncharacterized protein n=1 Tax=Stylosanthes scabra TaxID=79078 RepID=A0ABU6RXW6_9FABA|nr:hypothetical protein [Stylosanthes scabra]